MPELAPVQFSVVHVGSAAQARGGRAVEWTPPDAAAAAAAAASRTPPPPASGGGGGGDGAAAVVDRGGARNDDGLRGARHLLSLASEVIVQAEGGRAAARLAGTHGADSSKSPSPLVRARELRQMRRSYHQQQPPEQARRLVAACCCFLSHALLIEG